MVDLKEFKQIYGKCVGRIGYKLGAKIALSVSPDHLAGVSLADCSGFCRWIVYRASDKKIIMPDGSWNQRVWCGAQGWHRLARYSDVGLPEVKQDESRLFIGFMKPVMLGKKQIKAGHVWMISAGKTYESRGGKGVSSRAWNSPVLRLRCSDCYEVPTA